MGGKKLVIRTSDTYYSRIPSECCPPVAVSMTGVSEHCGSQTYDGNSNAEAMIDREWNRACFIFVMAIA